ncbi:MAG: CPBP family intramembrane metalloprotease, partial [Bacteroidota bacterium]|nr:CPBP family intramembrane metalloprotease [Bacteroidota bacterium]
IVYRYIPIRPYFPFIGEGLLLLATWTLYRTEGKTLSALGLTVSGRNIAWLLAGLFIAIVAFLVVTGLRTFYTGEVWHLSSAVDAAAMGESLYYILPTVMAQELLFRGYLFTKTISRLGVVRANAISALLFMLVHVLDKDVLQQPMQAIFLLVAIPVGHLWFATALLRSGTLLFPIGLHWGNNWAVQHLAGNADSTQNLFYLTGQTVHTTWSSFVVMLLIFVLFFLLVTWATWKIRWPLASKPTL